jgi:[acyl-carrier-protein] S-malonyltransferase
LVARAFVFPGQGSQAVGMGVELAAAFPVARYTLQEVDDALSQHLAKLMAEGPESELMLTENAQPALMAASLAVVRVIEQEGNVSLSKVARFVAGHSLGEYSALCAAGSLALADTARLLKRRGKAMQEAVPVGLGAMAALLGVDLDVAKDIAAAATKAPDGGTEVCDPANDNAPGQVVVSGHATAIDRAIEIGKTKGARRSIKLTVSAPFHCALMKSAGEVMEEALAATAIAPPSVPLIANVTAAPIGDPTTIRRLLVEQVTAMVRWRESVLAMKAADIDTVVELGAGKVLSGLCKRIDPDVQGISVGTPAEVEALLKTF